MKVLSVNDFASSAYTMQKFMDIDLDIIYFSKTPVISESHKKLMFKPDLPSQIKQIKSLANEYDIFLCFGWQAAMVCYLAGVRYIMSFNDEYIDQDRIIRKKMKWYVKKGLLRLYKDVFKNAVKFVGVDPNIVSILKKYRQDVPMIYPMVDTEMFNTNKEKPVFEESKFVYLSPTRIEEGKGNHILWKALELTHSDFVVLQVDWGNDEYYEKMKATLPKKVRLIPKIPRGNLAAYFKSSDAMLGQISATTCGKVELEAILCGVPVFCYVPIGFTDKDPFYKISKDPVHIAGVIDNIVNSESLRCFMAEKQMEWIKKTFDNKSLAEQWNKVFAEVKNIKPKKPKAIYGLAIKLYILLKGRKVK